MLAAGCRQRLAGFWGKRDRDQKDHDHAKCEAQGVNPAFVSHPHHPLSQGSGQPPVRNRRPAGKSPATFIIRALSKAVNLLGRILWFSCFSGCFGLDFSRAAPEQHRHLPDLREEPGNSAPSLFSLSCFHIHSKTACRGFKSFCPCQKSQVSLVRYLTFSLVCGRIWQRGAAAPCAVRVVGRVRAGGTQATSRPRRQPRPSPSAPAKNRQKHCVSAGFLFACVV